jgi:hypothetical protein
MPIFSVNELKLYTTRQTANEYSIEVWKLNGKMTDNGLLLKAPYPNGKSCEYQLAAKSVNNGITIKNIADD